MNRAIALSGGAAAIIAASATYLFPPFDNVGGVNPQSHEEFERGQAAFASALSESRGDFADMAHLGLTSREIDGVDGTVLVSESPGECSDRGIYWMRPSKGTDLAITAPHRGSDRHTGTLASVLFVETQARAAAWNSAPRRANATCPHGLDLARQKHHLFSAFTLGFAQAMPQGLIIQLHGFEGARRHSEVAQTAGMIISNGTREPGAKILDLADCLSVAFAPDPVLVYPIETGELGALTNVQGRLLREQGFDGFVHLEISFPLRKALLGDENLRAELANCLIGAAS